MNEKITLDILNDYLDDSLSEEEVQQLEALLVLDHEARVELKALRELLDTAACLPRGIAPERDLWNDIQNEITPATTIGEVIPLRSRVRRTLFGPIGFAAAAILLIMPTLHLVRSLQEDPFLDPENSTPMSLTQELVRADQVYRRARIDALTPLKEESTPVSAETMRVIQENLDRIDQAVAEIQGALVEAPENARLIKLLIATREKERSLLQQLSSLSQST